ncbi:MAG: hypothetical protein V4476_00900 [Pseudomonadota bacterium]
MSAPSLFLSDEAWPYCWLLEISDRKLGVHAHDGWCMQSHGRVLAIDPDIMCIHLLPVLELPAQDFLEFLVTAELRFPQYAASIRKFPTKSLLRQAFNTSGAGYWQAKALDWLENDPALQQTLKAELEALTLNKVMPQGSRQTAKRMIRNLSAVSV